MKPDVPVVLGALAGLIQNELAGGLQTTYAGQQLLRVSVNLAGIGEEFDRAASRRVDENRAMRQLFLEALPYFPGGEGDAGEAGALRRDLALAAQDSDDDLRVSALQRSNEGLRALLIRLQAWTETQDAGRVATLDEALWLELRRSTERRALPTDRM